MVSGIESGDAPLLRRSTSMRALLALGGVAAFALLALAALLLGGALSREAALHVTAADPGSAVATGEFTETPPALHAIHQQPSTRARFGALAVLAVTAVVAVVACTRIRRAPSRRRHGARVRQRPPGRAPPLLRIA
jgi:hypothetical protein